MGEVPTFGTREELNSKDTAVSAGLQAREQSLAHPVHESRHSFWAAAMLRAAAKQSRQRARRPWTSTMSLLA